MLSLSFYNGDINRPQIYTVLYLYVNSISQTKISEVFNVIQHNILEPFNDEGKINVYEAIPNIQNILGESAAVSIDMNMDYYGTDYAETVLNEWNCHKLIIQCHTSQSSPTDNMVYIEEEGSLSILYELMQQTGISIF
jgi:hypothetical protein